MKRLGRALRLFLHLALSALACAWFLATRRGAPVLFTHAPDVGPDGRDAQMGPLVEALVRARRPFVEVTWVALDGGLWRNLRGKGRLFVSHAALAAVARALQGLGRSREGARLAVGTCFLRALGARAVFAIDESGSGQLLVRAARRLGLRTIGVQHGDFQPASPQYARPGVASRGTEPVDCLCVWSPWFRRRLLALSPLYDERNTRVTGRLRFADDSPATRADGERTAVSVLLVADAGPGFGPETAPFVAALLACPDLALVLRPHPSEPGGGARGSLAADLLRADVVLGVASSALLEAVRRERPAVVLLAGPRPDPAGYAAEGIARSCATPAALPELCRRLARRPAGEGLELRERVWGGAPVDAAAEVLDCARDPSISGV